MTKSTYTTTRYTLYDNGFYVDVIKLPTTIEIWLGNVKYLHEMCIGVYDATFSEKDYEHIINHELEPYITNYWSQLDSLRGEYEHALEWEDFDESINYVKAERN